ncbi:MAG: HPr kinase/phosphatase C-terminal domain-containing protein [Hyphomicrobiales bacterium]|nr:HPr kinase/phosphatase C-terminal domain-containing protein [Hyphomicrobiales bacterium]
MADNFHASAVVLGDRGILIAGPSGSGKSQLAMALLAEAAACGLFARLVADDQVFLSAHDGRLICAAPPTIAGLIEVRGLGPRPVLYESRAPVDLLVRLVERRDTARLAEAETERLLGCSVPLLRVAADDRQAGRIAVLAQLALLPFG